MSAGNMLEQNGHVTMKPKYNSNKATASSNGLGRRGLTISEAEMRRSFGDDEYIGFTNTRYK
jgi:hypothetical protein